MRRDSLTGDLDTIGVTGGDRLARRYLDAEPLERPAGGRRRLLRETRKNSRSSFNQHDPRAGRVDVAKIMDQGSPRELRDRPRKLHTGRPGTDQHKIEQPAAFIRTVANFRGLESAEDLLANGERIGECLDAGREFLPIVVTEI